MSHRIPLLSVNEAGKLSIRKKNQNSVIVCYRAKNVLKNMKYSNFRDNQTLVNLRGLGP